MNNVMPAPSSLDTYYYEPYDKFSCCYLTPYKNFAQQWPAFGGIHPWINFEVLVLPYDHIKFKPEYKDYTLEEHLDYARQSKKFIFIDKTYEHVHSHDDFMSLYNNLKNFDLLERCIVWDNTADETLFKQYNVPHIYYPGYVFFYIMEQKKLPIFNVDPQYQFLCLNNYHKYHRLASIYTLDQLNFLKRTAWSYRSKVNDIKGMQDILPDFDMEKMNVSLPKYLDQDERAFNQDANIGYLHGDALSTIVTETDYFFNNTTFATEKSINALYFGTVPIFISSPGTVNLLREQSIDVYDDMIDHSYDEEQDPKKRFELITKVIEHVGGWRIYKDIKSNLAQRIIRNQILLTHDEHWINITDFNGNKFFTENKISI